MADEADSCDQDCARVLVTQGKILPLSEILKMTEKEITGEIVEIELENEEGLWVYEISTIDAEGRLIEMEIDAASGRLLEQEVDQ